MKKIYLLLLFSQIFHTSFAQDEESIEIWDYHKLKTDILSPFMVFKEIRFAYEFPLQDNTSSQIEITFIDNQYLSQMVTSNVRKRGFRVKADMRFFLSKRRNTAVYICPEAFYKYERFRDRVWVHRYNRLFQQEYGFNGEVNVFSTNIKIGQQDYYPKFGIILDYYIGVGVRVRYEDDNLPKDAEPVNGDVINYMGIVLNEDQFYPNVTLGVQLGILLNRN